MALSELAERNLRIARAAIIDGETIRANSVLSDFVFPQHNQKEVTNLLIASEEIFYKEQIPRIKSSEDRARLSMLFEMGNARRFVNFIAKDANTLGRWHYMETKRTAEEQFSKVRQYARTANMDEPEELTSLERRFNYLLSSSRH